MASTGNELLENFLYRLLFYFSVICACISLLATLNFGAALVGLFIPLILLMLFKILKFVAIQLYVVGYVTTNYFVSTPRSAQTNKYQSSINSLCMISIFVIVFLEPETLSIYLVDGVDFNPVLAISIVKISLVILWISYVLSTLRDFEAYAEARTETPTTSILNDAGVVLSEIVYPVLLSGLFWGLSPTSYRDGLHQILTRLYAYYLGSESTWALVIRDLLRIAYPEFADHPP